MFKFSKFLCASIVAVASLTVIGVKPAAAEDDNHKVIVTTQPCPDGMKTIEGGPLVTKTVEVEVGACTHFTTAPGDEGIEMEGSDQQKRLDELAKQQADALAAQQADKARLDELAAAQKAQAEALARLATRQTKPGRLHIGLLGGYMGEAGPVGFVGFSGTFLDGRMRLTGRLGINEGGAAGDEGKGMYGADAMIHGYVSEHIMLAGGATITQRIHLGNMLDTPTLRFYGAAFEAVYQVESKKLGVEVFLRGDVLRQTYDAPEMAPLDKSIVGAGFGGVRVAL